MGIPPFRSRAKESGQFVVAPGAHSGTSVGSFPQTASHGTAVHRAHFRPGQRYAAALHRRHQDLERRLHRAPVATTHRRRWRGPGKRSGAERRHDSRPGAPLVTRSMRGPAPSGGCACQRWLVLSPREGGSARCRPSRQVLGGLVSTVPSGGPSCSSNTQRCHGNSSSLRRPVPACVLGCGGQLTAGARLGHRTGLTGTPMGAVRAPPFAPLRHMLSRDGSLRPCFRAQVARSRTLFEPSGAPVEDR